MNPCSLLRKMRTLSPGFSFSSSTSSEGIRTARLFPHFASIILDCPLVSTLSMIVYPEQPGQTLGTLFSICSGLCWMAVPGKACSMVQRFPRGCSVLLFAALAVPVYAARPKACFTADEASRMVNKDVCITAHVYDVVQLADGTRFLDICPPEMPDERCRFTVVSFWADHGDVGELRR